MLASSRSQTQVWFSPASRATLAISVFVFLTVTALAVGAAPVLRYAYSLMAAAVGVMLFFDAPNSYISFTWWLWFLTPFVRRLIDNQSGWVDPSPVLLAPLVVTMISGVSLVRNVRFLGRGGLPFFLCFTAIAYSACVGLASQAPLQTVILPLASWTAPMFFAFHLFVRWREYPEVRAAMQKTFIVGTLIMGCYGVFQFLFAPVWDTYWMSNVSMGAFGVPERLGIRVFSTMNAPQTYAVTIMAALLLLMVAGGSWRVPVAIAGYMSFLLTSSRGAWLGWSVGFVCLLLCTKLRHSVRIIFIVLLVAACLLPLAMWSPFTDVITSRLESFSHGRSDVSFRARMEGYEALLGDAAAKPFGKGLGVMDREYKTSGDDDRLGPHDSMYLELLLSLGWFGAALYVGALILTLLHLFTRKGYRQDPFVAVCIAHTVGLVAQFPLESFALSVQGMTLWTFLSLALAGQRYISSQDARTHGAPAPV